MLPNYIVIGAEKAGSTTVTSLINSHPEGFVCSPKEPRFFSDNDVWIKGLSWYEGLFSNTNNAKAIGEGSVSYSTLSSELIAQRIYSVLGNNVKYIYVLRNPIDRLVSHYKHAIFNEWIDSSLPIENAILEEPVIIDTSKYYSRIAPYLDYSNANQWLIFSIEELNLYKAVTLNKLLSFLQIDCSFKPSIPIKNRSTEKILLPKFYKKLMLIPSFRRIRYRIPSIFINFEQALGKPIPEPTITNDLMCYLAHLFIPEINMISEFAGQKFNDIWNIEKAND